jgi:hypothetical protein
MIKVTEELGMNLIWTVTDEESDMVGSVDQVATAQVGNIKLTVYDCDCDRPAGRTVWFNISVQGVEILHMLADKDFEVSSFEAATTAAEVIARTLISAGLRPS